MVTTYQYLDGTERPITVTRNGEVTHDANGNVVAVRSPRYFDSADTLGYQQASEAFSYTRRNLKATHTVAAGAQAYANPDDAGWSAAKVRVTESWAYNLDRTLDTHTDFRGNGWQSLWSSCCAGRLVAQNDPLGAATTMAHDAQGNATLSQKVHGLTIFNQQTTRFDARNRPIARTVWLVEQTGIDPQNPPIAGGGLAGVPPDNSKDDLTPPVRNACCQSAFTSLSKVEKKVAGAYSTCCQGWKVLCVVTSRYPFHEEVDGKLLSPFQKAENVIHECMKAHEQWHQPFLADCDRSNECKAVGAKDPSDEEAKRKDECYALAWTMECLRTKAATYKFVDRDEGWSYGSRLTIKFKEIMATAETHACKSHGVDVVNPQYPEAGGR